MTGRLPVVLIALLAGCHWAPAARAAAPPTAATGPASSITDHGAVFNGIVNPAGCGGAPTTVRFLYAAPSTTPLTATAPPVDSAQSLPVPVSVSVTTLIPATVYDVQLVAENGCGSARGAHLSVATLGGDTSTATPAPAAARPEATTGGGGAPVLPILVSAVALVLAGAGVWLRGRGR